MTQVRQEKVVANLPEELTPDTIYYVRTGQGFDLYVSDATGKIAHKINGGSVGLSEEKLLEDYLLGKSRATGQTLPSTPLNSVSNNDRILVYRRTQKFDFTTAEGGVVIPGNSIQYQFPIPDDFVGKFVEVFINNNVDARLSSCPKVLTLVSQDIMGGDEILVVAYEDSEHVIDILKYYGDS